MKGDSPVPVPLLAAALCADRQNLKLAYGHHLQPVMEKTVRTAEKLIIGLSGLFNWSIF